MNRVGGTLQWTEADRHEWEPEDVADPSNWHCGICGAHYMMAIHEKPKKDKICSECGDPIELAPKGTLYLDPETGISYRVVAHWLHVGKITPHVSYLQPQYPSGGGEHSMLFSTQLPETVVIVWEPK